jgi:hypothetical protein
MALAIPSGPVERVERWLPDGRWVGETDYEREVGDLSNHRAPQTAQADAQPEQPRRTKPTIRIHLAEWFQRQIAQGEVARVDFCVWAHLRPLGQRLYAWLQGSHRDSYDQAIEFYLAAPLRYTLGLLGPQHRAAASVRCALSNLYNADRRYQRAPKWSIRGRYANTNIPAFRIGPHRRASAPTPRAFERVKCPAARPAQLRGLTHRKAREQIELVRKTLQTHTPRNENRQAIASRAPLYPGAALPAGP